MPGERQAGPSPHRLGPVLSGATLWSMARKKRTLGDLLGIDRDKLNAKMDTQREKLDQAAEQHAAQAEQRRAELDRLKAQAKAQRKAGVAEKINLGLFLNAQIGAGRIAIIDSDPNRFLADTYTDRGGVVYLPAEATIGMKGRTLTLRGANNTRWMGWIPHGQRDAIEKFADYVNEISQAT